MTGRVPAVKTPWSRVMVEVLSDGQPHSRRDVVAAGAAVVPARQAARSMNPTADANPAAIVVRGQMRIASQALAGLIRTGAVQAHDGAGDVVLRATWTD